MQQIDRKADISKLHQGFWHRKTKSCKAEAENNEKGRNSPVEKSAESQNIGSLLGQHNGARI